MATSTNERGTTGSRDQSLTLGLHSSLSLPVSLKVSSLQGTLPTHSLPELLDQPSLKHAGSQQPTIPSDLYILISLWADNKPLVPSVQTAHKVFKSKQQYVWNENITLAVKYRDLPLSAQLVVTVVDIAGPREMAIVGGSTMRLFGKKATLKKGKQRLFLWKGVEGDGRADSETPSKVGLKDEMGRLEKLVKRHERGDVPRMDWLDKLAFRQIERIHAAESAKSDHLFLYIDMPRFDFPVVFSEPEYPLPTLTPLTAPHHAASSSSHVPPSPSPTPSGPSSLAPPSSSSVASTSTGLIFSQPGDPPLFSIVDPEMARDNPVEAKHRRLVRSHRKGPLDKELKPNAGIRDELNEILTYPPTRSLLPAQLDLLWQFRFYLTRDKRALTKFLKSVTWTDPGEVSQAVEVLLPMWAEVEVDEVLELLGPGKGFRDRRVRAYAVGLLAKSGDEELMLYLLQLVQALKFEVPASSSSSSSTHQSPSSSLRASRHPHQTHKSTSSLVSPSPADTLPTLEDFLIERSAKNPVLGNHFYWYVRVEGSGDEAKGGYYRALLGRFEKKVAELQKDSSPDQLDLLHRQTEFVSRLSTLALTLRTSKDPRPKKIEKLRHTLQSTSSLLGNFPPIPHPLDARKTLVGIDSEKSSIFKSAMLPLKLNLICDDGTAYPIIYKNGDDLRQDQLVIQLFTLMDLLLLKENLDLKLMPYRVLATGKSEGMCQFVESKTIADVSSEFGGVLGWLRKEGGDEGAVGTYGVRADVLDTFVRSCAGYCVVTYLLGVGDRHLDNLLLSPDGHFFHVDFGYILGSDPKPFAPAIKVCKEMVDGMGGIHSHHYARFKSLCFTGFTSLRKNANLIINLVGLMVDSGVREIVVEPDKAVAKVQDKFLLNLSEEDAIKAFEALLNETSYFTSVLDRIHSVAQYWRA